MKYTVEESLHNFQFWSGGKDRADKCSIEELDSIEEFLEEIAPEDGWTDSGINDMFWFEFDTLAQHLGYKNEEDFDLQHDPNYLDDDDLEEFVEEWFTDFLQGIKEREGTDGMVSLYENCFSGDYMDFALTDEEKESVLIFQASYLDLVALYKQAALFVFPSFAEGFGIPPIEAVAYSCPTLCSNQTAMAEFDFFHECFFSPYDIRELKNKIMYFIQNDVTQICEALQKEIVARYNWKNVGEKLYQLIKDDKK